MQISDTKRNIKIFMTGRNINSEAFPCTKGDVLADFKLERPNTVTLLHFNKQSLGIRTKIIL